MSRYLRGACLIHHLGPLYLWGLHYKPEEFPGFPEVLTVQRIHYWVILATYGWSRDGQYTMKRPLKTFFSVGVGKGGRGIRWIYSWAGKMEREKIEIKILFEIAFVSICNKSFLCEFKGLLAAIFSLSCGSCGLSSRDSRQGCWKKSFEHSIRKKHIWEVEKAHSDPLKPICSHLETCVSTCQKNKQTNQNINNNK